MICRDLNQKAISLKNLIKTLVSRQKAKFFTPTSTVKTSVHILCGMKEIWLCLESYYHKGPRQLTNVSKRICYYTYASDVATDNVHMMFYQLYVNGEGYFQHLICMHHCLQYDDNE